MPLTVPGSLQTAWDSLASRHRAHLDSYFEPSSERDLDVLLASDDLPSLFGDDLVRGGLRLRAAFPGLARELITLELGTRIEVAIRCQGTHEAAFYDIVTATGRRVEFIEKHTLMRSGGRPVDVVAIEIRAIVTQLSGRSGQRLPGHGRAHAGEL
jgi:hypothetical protein